MQTLPIIELRRIEANIIKPIHEEMVKELGEGPARRILGQAIRRNAIEQGRGLAEASPEPPGIAAFAGLLERWKANDALRMETLEQSDERLDFNVTRCRYAEMYREMGLAGIGHLLSCNRDGALCEGLRSAARAHPHPDDHGRGVALQLPLSMEKRRCTLKPDAVPPATRRGGAKPRTDDPRAWYDRAQATPPSNEEGFQCPLIRQSGNASTASWARTASCSS